MNGVVRRWGKGAAVRIPAAIMEAAHLRLDQPVVVREDGGRVVIEAASADPYDIETLVAGITDENRHDSVDMGPAAGNEAW